MDLRGARRRAAARVHGRRAGLDRGQPIPVPRLQAHPRAGLATHAVQPRGRAAHAPLAAGQPLDPGAPAAALISRAGEAVSGWAFWQTLGAGGLDRWLDALAIKLAGGGSA